MEVRKGSAEQELGITLFGPTFGRKGAIKKVQGRHAAIRVLVEVSMLQIVGKYMKLPYWRLLGDDAEPDPYVLEAVQKAYYGLDDERRVRVAQQWLYVWGYPTNIDGKLDEKTLAGLSKVNPGFSASSKGIDLGTFTKLYTDMPYDVGAYGRKQQLARTTTGSGTEEKERPKATAAAAAPAAPQPKPAAQAAAPAPQPQPKQASSSPPPTKPAPAAPAPAPQKRETASQEPPSRPAPPKEPAPAKEAAVASTPAPAPAPKSGGTTQAKPAPAGGPVPAAAVGRMLKEGDW